MPDAKLREVHEHDQPRIIPAEFQTGVQSLLETLADIDFAHQRELETVNSADIHASFKAKMVAKLEQGHQQRRQPYAQELLRLQEWMRSRLMRESVESD